MSEYVQQNEMNSVEAKDWLELYWNYFQLHAGQRMKLLEFYLLLITVLFGALYTVHFTKTTTGCALEIIICIGITMISVAFLCLDYRTAQLVKYAEEAFRSTENNLINDDEESIKSRLFSYAEKQDTKKETVLIFRNH